MIVYKICLIILFYDNSMDFYAEYSFSLLL